MYVRIHKLKKTLLLQYRAEAEWTFHQQIKKEKIKKMNIQIVLRKMKNG